MKKRVIKLDLSNLDRSSILRLIRTSYRNGFDSIEIVHKNPETTFLRKADKAFVRDVIRDEVTRLIGGKIEQQDAKSARITVAAAKNMDITELTTRCIKKCVDIMNDLLLLFKGHIYVSKLIEEKHDSLTMLVSFGIREINRSNMSAAGFHTQTLLLLDKIADFAKYVARDYTLSQRPMSTTTIRLFTDLYDCVTLYEQLYEKYTSAHVLAFFTKRDDTKRHIVASVKTLNPQESYMIGKASGILEVLVQLTESRMAIAQL